MISEPTAQIAGLVVLAVGAGWFADRARIPAILPLLAVGLLLGPGLGVVDPDALLGDLLDPLVGLAVGVILFEGGLTLRVREVTSGAQRAIWSLVTVGAATTWAVATIASFLLLDVGVGLAVVIGAILVVSGPTVIGPVLQAVRPDRQVASILKWESILVDPIGAMLAVIAFDVVIEGAGRGGFAMAAGRVAMFVVVGVAAGAIVAVMAIVALRRHWVPEHLISLFGLAAALVAYAWADTLVHESGLLATIVLGVALANYKHLRTEPLSRFSEILRVLLIGILFILLSARLDRVQIASLGWNTVALVAVMVLIARPVSVILSTARSGLDRRARVLLSGVAPRGIVAASVASVFGAAMEDAGVPGADQLVPVVFAVIIATVLIYGLGSGPLARALGLAPRSHEGVLVLGAGPVERAVSEALSAAGVYVMVATVNPRDARAARAAGLQTFYGNVLSFDVDLRLELSGIGKLMALTPNDDVNTLAARRFQDIFGGAGVYQLPAARPSRGVDPVELGGRALFGTQWTYQRLAMLVEHEGVRRTPLTGEFGRDEFLRHNGGGLLVLMVVRQGRLMVTTVDAPTPLVDRLQPGDQVLWLPVTGKVTVG